MKNLKSLLAILMLISTNSLWPGEITLSERAAAARQRAYAARQVRDKKKKEIETLRRQAEAEAANELNIGLPRDQRQALALLEKANQESQTARFEEIKNRILRSHLQKKAQNRVQLNLLSALAKLEDSQTQSAMLKAIEDARATSTDCSLDPSERLLNQLEELIRQRRIDSLRRSIQEAAIDSSKEVASLSELQGIVKDYLRFLNNEMQRRWTDAYKIDSLDDERKYAYERVFAQMVDDANIVDDITAKASTINLYAPLLSQADVK